MMDCEEMLVTFGPVPSRRFGHSLGITNIPPKICTYSCVYCQLGRTIHMQVKRQEFYKPEEIVQDVERKVKEIGRRGETIDYLTFVQDAEPTLYTFAFTGSVEEDLLSITSVLRKGTNHFDK